MPEKDRELEIIQPANMTFVFRMDDGECHLKLTGICSLEKAQPDPDDEAGGESGYDFCPRLLQTMTDGSFPIEQARKLPIDVIGYKCGHWEFSDGQHRTCIAKRKNLTVEAEVSTEPTKSCTFCEGIPISEHADVR